MKRWAGWAFSVFSVLFRAEGQEYYFNRYDVGKGLSNNSVICSVQDKAGFLWFGTKDGLNRFDGYTFRQFYSDPGSDDRLGSNFIHSLMVDRGERLWVGTDQGLYIYDAATERFSLFAGTRHGEILEIKEGADGTVWFISNNRLFFHHPATAETLEAEALRGRTLSALAIDPQGGVWASSPQMLTNVLTGQSIAYPAPMDGDMWVEVLMADRNGNIWVGTSKHGVLLVDPKAGVVRHLIPQDEKGRQLFVRDIRQVDDNTFWIATESGLLIYKQAENSVKTLKNESDNPRSLSDNAVYTVCTDHQGGVWVGTYFGGINYYHVRHTYFEKIHPRFLTASIRGRAVREMLEDPTGGIWIGTEDNGLNYWERKNGQFSHFSTASGLSHSNIHGLALAGDSLLIGTFQRGMDVLDVKTKKVIAHFDRQSTGGVLGDNFVVSIRKTRKGRFLLATSRGLYEFFPGKNTFKRLEEVPEHISYTSIFEDRDENIWLATWRDGLYHISAETGETSVFQHNPADALSINANRVNHIYQHSSGRIWIATENGLSLWESAGKPIRRFTREDGLPSNIILAMAEDGQGKLWISTTYGLVCMDPDDFRLTLYNEESGLLDMQFNYNSVLRDAEGYLYFGSSNGMVRFCPDFTENRETSGRQVPIHITGLKSLDREVSIPSREPRGIRLAHDESTVHIDFAALNFVSPESTSYLYRLDGFDQNRTLSRRNAAYFTKIPPGKYTFYVRALDNRGQPISDEIALPIVIRPPAWASAPAYALYAIALILFLYYLMRYYDNRIKEKNRRRLHEIRAHRERELYRAKMTFFSQVAHDIKTPLTLMKAPLERIREMPGLKDPKMLRLLDTMHKNTQKLVKLTDSILDFRQMESGQTELKLKKEDVNLFVEGYLHEFQPLFQQRNIMVEYRSEVHVEILVDLDILSKIIDNLLTNAVKYAETRVTVTSFFDEAGENWLLTVKNDGQVPDMAERGKLFMPFQRADAHLHIEGSGLGLALAHSFAILHGGDLVFLENPENLNIFVLRIPIH